MANRAEHTRTKLDKTSQLEIGLYDIDSAIKFYFDNKIIPRVFTSTGEPMQVPVVYGSPERWKSVQKSSYWRDKDGKIQIPLIMYKRTSMARNQDVSSKVDPDNPLVSYTENKYSKINKYDKFSKTYGTQQVKEYNKLIIPDFVKLSYSVIIWTDLIMEMNKITEAINYSVDGYWGDPDKFTFKAKVDSFSKTHEVTAGSDRLIRSEFTLDLDGYIISDNIQKAMALKSKNSYGPATVRVGSETVVDVENIPWLSKVILPNG